MKVKTDFVPASNDYLTAGKIYEATAYNADLRLYNIQNDMGRKNTILLEDCAHLEGGDWEVVEE